MRKTPREGGRCVERTIKGGFCRNKATHGGVCTLHYNKLNGGPKSPKPKSKKKRIPKSQRPKRKTSSKQFASLRKGSEKLCERVMSDPTPAYPGRDKTKCTEKQWYALAKGRRALCEKWRRENPSSDALSEVASPKSPAPKRKTSEAKRRPSRNRRRKFKKSEPLALEAPKRRPSRNRRRKFKKSEPEVAALPPIPKRRLSPRKGQAERAAKAAEKKAKVRGRIEELRKRLAKSKANREDEWPMDMRFPAEEE